MKHKFSVSLTLALIVAMLVTSLAVADQVVNTIDNDIDSALETTTIDAGEETVVGFYIKNINTQQGGDPVNSCNVSGAFPATVTFNVPSGVTAYPPSLEFTDCDVTRYVTFSSNIPDSYEISIWSVTGGRTGGAWDTAPAAFELEVDAPVVTDTTAPVITPNISGTLGNNNWYTSDVTVSWTVVDNESAISSTSGCGLTFIDTDTAGTTSTCTATSAGGTSSQSVTIMRDVTAPTVSTNPEPPANVNSWNNTDVTVSFSGSDALSGIDFCSAPVVLNSEGAGQSASGTCTDKAGNSADATASDVNIDKTKPTTSASASPAPNIEDWNNTDVTVSFDGFDTLSGIDFCDAAVVLSSEGAEQSASGTCTDKAGNVSTPATVSGINIDKTGPAISLLGGPEDGASYYFGFVPAPPSELEILVSDNLSGPYLVGLAGYGPEVGTHTMTVTAYDKAGNLSTLSRTYTVLAWTLNGFYQPVDMNGVWNTVKGGSTVPFKFEVFAGSIELTDTSVVSSFVAAPVACPASSVVADAIEFTTTGGTSLRYDSVAGQFINNWQTPKKPGACYVVTMTTKDGSTLSANFKLK